MADAKPRTLQLIDNQTKDTLEVDWYEKDLPTDKDVDEIFSTYRAQKEKAPAKESAPVKTTAPLEYDERGAPILPENRPYEEIYGRKLFDKELPRQAPDEQKFREWYAGWSKKTGIDPNPDDPRHQYDYRAAFQAGVEPQISPEDQQYHWPSQFKADTHPNRFIKTPQGVLDTKYGVDVSDTQARPSTTRTAYQEPTVQFAVPENAPITAKAPTPEERKGALESGTPEERAMAIKYAAEQAATQERPISAGYESAPPESIEELYTSLLNPLSGLFRGVETMKEAAEKYRLATKKAPLQAAIESATAIGQAGFGALEAAPYLTGMASPSLAAGAAARAIPGAGAANVAKKFPSLLHPVATAGVFKGFQLAHEVPGGKEVLGAAMAPVQTIFQPKPGITRSAAEFADMLATFGVFGLASKIRMGEPLQPTDAKAINEVIAQAPPAVGQKVGELSQQYQNDVVSGTFTNVPKNPYARLTIKQMQTAFEEAVAKKQPFDVSPWINMKVQKLFEGDEVSTQDLADLATSVRAYNSQFVPEAQPKKPAGEEKLQRMKKAAKAVKKVAAEQKAPEAGTSDFEQLSDDLKRIISTSGHSPEELVKMPMEQLQKVFTEQKAKLAVERSKQHPAYEKAVQIAKEAGVRFDEINKDAAGKDIVRFTGKQGFTDSLPVEDFTVEKVKEAVAKKEIAKPTPESSEAAIPKQAEGDSYQQPITDISVDEKRFQNRTALDEDRVKNIVENYDEREFDPVVVWTDPATGKKWLLSGHHRLEAAKRLGLKDIKAREFKGTEAEAVNYATVRSNQNRSLEKPWERAKIYRKMRKGGASNKDILAAAKRDELGNAPLTIALSHLNTKGEALTDLSNLPAGSEGGRDVLTMAQWLGNLREHFPDLADRHENEIYRYIKENYKTEGRKFKKYGDIEDFMAKVIDRRRAGADRLNALQPLNIKEITPESPQEAKFKESFKEQREAAANAIDAFTAKLKEKKRAGAPKDEIDAIQKSLSIAKDDLAKIDAQIEEGVQKIRGSEMGLFDQDVAASRKTLPKPTEAELRFAEEERKKGNNEPMRQIAERQRQIKREQEVVDNWRKLQDRRSEAEQIRRELRSGLHTPEEATKARDRLRDVVKEIGHLQRSLGDQDAGLLAEKALDLFDKPPEFEHKFPSVEKEIGRRIQMSVLTAKKAADVLYVGIDKDSDAQLRRFADRHPIMRRLMDATNEIFRDIYKDMGEAFTKRGWQSFIEEQPKVMGVGLMNSRGTHAMNVRILDRAWILMNPDILLPEYRSGLNRPDQIAAHWVNALIHEGVHNYARGHDEYYTILREYAQSHLGVKIVELYNRMGTLFANHEREIQDAVNEFQTLAKDPGELEAAYAKAGRGGPAEVGAGKLGERPSGQAEAPKTAEGRSDVSASRKTPDFQVATEEMRKKNDKAARDLADALSGGEQKEIFDVGEAGKMATVRPRSVISDMKQKSAIFMMEGRRQGYTGKGLAEYVRSQLIEMVKSSPQYRTMSAKSRIKALDKATSEGVGRWLTFFDEKAKKIAVAEDIERKHKELLREVQQVLSGSGVPPEEVKKLLTAAEDFPHSYGSQNTFLKLFMHKPAVFAKFYGAPGPKLVRMFYEGDVDRARMTNTANVWIARVRKIYEGVDGTFERKRISRAVADALDNRAKADEILSAMQYKDPKSAALAKEVYAQAKNFFDYFKNELRRKGYDVLEDYFPHMKKLFDADYLLQNLDDIDAGKPKPLADILAAKSPYLKEREDLLHDWRKDPLTQMQNYVRSVTRAVAYHDALEYAHNRFVREIPHALQGNSLTRATTFIRNVLDPEKSEGKIYRVANKIRRAMYDNFLSFNGRAATMNSTQIDLAKLMWAPETSTIFNRIWRNKNAGKTLNDAADEAGLETPSFLGEMLLEDPKQKDRIRRWIDEHEWFKQIERRNWSRAEFGSLIDSVVRNKNWKTTRAKYEEGAFGDIKAIDELMSNPEVYSRAIEEARYIAGVSQVASSPAMRAEFYDKPVLRIMGMFTAFKMRQLQLLAESMSKHEGVSGRNAQHILRMGLVDGVKKVEVLRAIETERTRLEKWLATAKKEKENIGVTYDQAQTFIDYLKGSEKELNQTIREIAKLPSRAQNVRLLSKYYSKIFFTSIAWSVFWDLAEHGYDGVMGNKQDEDDQETLVSKALWKAILELGSMPWYGTNPARFMVTPVIPDIEAMPFGKFSERNLTRDVVSYGMNAIPYAGLIDRITGRRMSKNITDLVAPPKGGSSVRGGQQRGPTRGGNIRGGRR